MGKHCPLYSYPRTCFPFPSMNRAFALVRGYLVGACFVALQMYFLPRWLGVAADRYAPLREPARLAGLAPLALGAAVMLHCVWNFGSAGQGTPAPFDPPQRLVTRGLYRHVRNPMYLGMALALAGEAILFAVFNATLFWYALGLIVAVNLFVRFYEEPALRRKFGAAYEEYCASVPRWLPRRRPH